MRGIRNSARGRWAVVAIGASMALILGACTAGETDGDDGSEPDGGTDDGGGTASCDNTITKTDAPQVTVWGWYPNMPLVVDNFNELNDDVQICWTNAGQGNEEYDRFQTTISAGSGGPDVVMLEADRIPTFVVQNALVDISDYGYEDVKGNFSEGAWKDVSVGDAVYGAPVDGGPMGMIYRSDVFEEYGITPPTTWAEYETAAQTVKDAGGPLFGDVGANVPAVFMALVIQNGAQPFTYDPTVPEEIGIKVNDDGSKEVMDFWAGLVAKGLVGTQDQFTPEYIAGMVGGDYATYISAAWAPGYLTGAGVGGGEDAGTFSTAPIPQWDPANPVSVNWGGSAFSVTTQAKDPELAAKVAFGIYADEASLRDGWENQIIFPLNNDVLSSDEFINAEVGFFAGQQANKEVYVPAANAYKGFTYSPFGQFYYASFTEELAAINAGEKTGSQAMDDLQAKLVSYAEDQGFTVTE